jgi:hypothetical protein
LMHRHGARQWTVKPLWTTGCNGACIAQAICYATATGPCHRWPSPGVTSPKRVSVKHSNASWVAPQPRTG